MNEGRPSPGIPRSWFIFPAIAGLIALLFSPHRQHTLDYLPFLILLACPLMHMFMHGKHGHGGSHGGYGSAMPRPEDATARGRDW